MEQLCGQTKELILDYLRFRAGMLDPAPNSSCSRMRELTAEVEAQYRTTYEELIAFLGLEGEPWASRVKTIYDVFHVSLHKEGPSWGLMISLMAFAGVEVARAEAPDPTPCLESLAENLANVVLHTSGAWVLEQGGWETMPPPPESEPGDGWIRRLMDRLHWLRRLFIALWLKRRLRN